MELNFSSLYPYCLYTSDSALRSNRYFVSQVFAFFLGGGLLDQYLFHFLGWNAWTFCCLPFKQTWAYDVDPLDSQAARKIQVPWQISSSYSFHLGLYFEGGAFFAFLIVHKWNYLVHYLMNASSEILIGQKRREMNQLRRMVYFYLACLCPFVASHFGLTRSCSLHTSQGLAADR